MMLKRCLTLGAAVALSPVWVPCLVVVAIPIFVAEIVRREWEQSIFDRARKEARREREQ